MIDFGSMKKLTVGGVVLKQLLIGGIQVWKSGYKNWVPVSTTADGVTVYNGTGYKEGYRLSSSGAEKTQTGAVLTGFIPAQKGDVIRMAGAAWGTTVSGGYCYLQVYNAAFSPVAQVNRYMNEGSTGLSNYDSTKIDGAASRILTDENGVTTFDIAWKSGVAFSYFRISATGKGAEMVVTVNEEVR